MDHAMLMEMGRVAVFHEEMWWMPVFNMRGEA